MFCDKIHCTQVNIYRFRVYHLINMLHFTKILLNQRLHSYPGLAVLSVTTLSSWGKQENATSKPHAKPAYSDPDQQQV